MVRLLLRYNARICAGLGAWMIVVPVAATMLVLFALMAMTSLIRDWMPVMILEMLGSLVMAFVGVSLLRPEYQYNALETVLSRPISFRVILTVRVFFAGLIVLALQALLALYMRTVMHKPFSMGLALAATVVSMGFLTALATVVAAAWRSPTFGFVVGAAYWVLDLAVGPRLNALLTLRGYSQALALPQSPFSAWWVGKLILCGLTVVLLVTAARAGARPAPQRSLRRWIRVAVGLLAIAFVYVLSGAVYKVEWGQRHESVMPYNVRYFYREAFDVYGPLPIAYLAGPAFPHYIGYRAPWTHLRPDPTGLKSAERFYDSEQLKVAAFGYPNSAWADNALYELGRMTLGEEGDNAGAEATSLGAQYLEQLAADYPSSPFAPLALEKLFGFYEHTGRPAEAEQTVNRLLTVYPTSPSTQKAGQVLLARLTSPSAPGGPRPQDALPIAEKLARTATGDEHPRALAQLGAVLADPAIGRYPEAATALQQAADEASSLAMATLSLPSPGIEDIERRREFSDIRQQARDKLDELRREGHIPGG